MNTIIQTKNLSKSYGKTQVLKNMSPSTQIEHFLLIKDEHFLFGKDSLLMF